MPPSGSQLLWSFQVQLALQHCLERCEPALVVAATGIVRIAQLRFRNGLNQLLLKLAPLEIALFGEAYRDGERPALPVIYSDPRIEFSDLPQGIPEGDEIIEITIDAQGKIVQKVVISSLSPSVDAKVLAALENWHFLPATRFGVPIPSKQDVHYHFPQTPRG